MYYYSHTSIILHYYENIFVDPMQNWLIDETAREHFAAENDYIINLWTFMLFAKRMFYSLINEWERRYRNYTRYDFAGNKLIMFIQTLLIDEEVQNILLEIISWTVMNIFVFFFLRNIFKKLSRKGEIFSLKNCSTEKCIDSNWIVWNMYTV